MPHRPASPKRFVDRTREGGLARRDRMARTRLLRLQRASSRQRARYPCRSAKAHRCQIRALRRDAAGVRQQRGDERQAVDVRTSRITWPEQGRAALQRTARGEGRRAADREPSGPRVGPMDVDASHRAGSAHRPPGSLDALLRHRFQLRRSRGTRYRPVRLHTARRRHR